MAKPITLPSRSFTTQGAALDFFRDMMYRYDIGERISDPLDHQLLMELSERHKDAEEKAGPGIDHFFVNRTESSDFPVAANARGIWIRRINGEPVDWSYQTAIKKPGPKSNVKDALRVAVNSRRLAARDRAFSGGPVSCGLTGISIPSKAEADVIYRSPTWGELVEGFVETRGGWGSFETNSGFGGIAIGGRLEEPELSAWLDYWDTEARPMIVLANEGGRS